MGHENELDTDDNFQFIRFWTSQLIERETRRLQLNIYQRFHCKRSRVGLIKGWLEEKWRIVSGRAWSVCNFCNLPITCTTTQDTHFARVKGSFMELEWDGGAIGAHFSSRIRSTWCQRQPSTTKPRVSAHRPYPNRSLYNITLPNQTHRQNTL